MSTIKQVAKLAGVSFKTVSRVINKNSNVRKETRQRVEDAIRTLEYIPNLTARSMRTQQSQAIGFVTDQIATTPYAVDIIQGAQKTAWDNNKMLLVVNTQGDPVTDKRSIDMMIERRVEGIIYAAMYHKPVTLPKSIRNTDAVLINCFTEDNMLPSIVPDEYRGGKEATEILINKGHTKIAFINLPDESVAARGRLDGYKAALSSHDIPFREPWVSSGLVRLENGEQNIASEIALEMLSQEPAATAFFCGNDRIAIRVYDAIRKKGLSIPEDIAVIGFDNLELITENLSPGLSSMALPHEAMGRWAINQLLHPQTLAEENNRIRIHCPFVERGSV